ncbi:hypothetical protein, partial [Bacillus subtilis]|uniref:hypothetical protein n=1 Tax=Bacillus subtilis TaxID=1423 RepID=UPI0024AD0329
LLFKIFCFFFFFLYFCHLLYFERYLLLLNFSANLLLLLYGDLFFLNKKKTLLPNPKTTKPGQKQPEAKINH